MRSRARSEHRWRVFVSAVVVLAAFSLALDFMPAVCAVLLFVTLGAVLLVAWGWWLARLEAPWPPREEGDAVTMFRAGRAYVRRPDGSWAEVGP